MGFVKDHWMRRTALGYGDVPDKYVCAECFDDYAIKEFINENAVEKKCSYCPNKSDLPIAAELEIVVDFICQGINSEWDDPVECMGWDGGEGGWQGATVYDSDELIRYEIEELENTREEVLDDIVSSMIARQWCQRDPYGLRKEEALSLSWADFAEQVKHHARYIFFRLNDGEEQFHDPDMIPVSKMLDIMSIEITKLDRAIDLIKVLNVGGKIFRIRIHNRNKKLRTAKELGTVPTDSAIYSNRMSPAGIPMFYGAYDSETALKETLDLKKIAPWKIASIATFKTLKKIKVLDLSKLPEVPSLFDPQNRHLRSSIIFLRGFVLELSKPISKDGAEHIEYVPTQIFTEYIRHIYKAQEGDSLNGINYLSSKGTGGISCVLFIEDKQCCDQFRSKMNVSDNADNSNTDKYFSLDGVERRDICGILEWIKIKISQILIWLKHLIKGDKRC